MANQAFSEAADLMVGAGELYFARKDDSNGLHHLGNVEEFNITTDVTTVEKNSSMNRRRELMASVVTAVAPSASLTLTEYNPYNLALGLFGEEIIKSQAAVTLTNESYTVPSVPGIIELRDADGNRYHKVKNVALSLVTPIPSSYTFTGNSAGNPDDITSANLGVLTISGTYTGTSDKKIYIDVTQDVTAAGDVSGMVISWADSLAGLSSPNTITISATGTTDTQAIGSTGLSVTVTVPAITGDFASVVTSIPSHVIDCVASRTTLVAGTDYVVEEQSSRAGLIKINEGSVLQAGNTVLVSATIEAEELVTISGADAGEIEGRLLFIGDPNQGDVYNIEAWDVKIQPDGDLSGLISEDFGSFNLTIKFLADYKNHKDYPYYQVVKVGSASGTDIRQGTYDPLN